MSRGRRLGILLAIILLVSSVALAADIERCVTYACTYQEAQVGWDPQTCWDCQQQGEAVGLFILGLPLTVLFSLAILRRRRPAALSAIVISDNRHI